MHICSLDALMFLDVLSVQEFEALQVCPNQREEKKITQLFLSASSLVIPQYYFLTSIFQREEAAAARLIFTESSAG